MGTSMHRLQISLPQWELQFLSERARRDGVSIAEVIRQLVQREAEAHSAQAVSESIWSIAGIADDNGPLIRDVAVSECPELYLVEAMLPRPNAKLSRRKTARKRKPSKKR